MPLDELTHQFGVETTRRRVIKTGAKLAYAAPVAAATMKITAGSALAFSPICAAGIICGQFADCGEDSDNVCNCTASITGRLICGNNACGPACSSDAECQSYAPGAVCQAPNTGCCGQTCIAPCGAFDPTIQFWSADFAPAAAAVEVERSGSNSGR